MFNWFVIILFIVFLNSAHCTNTTVRSMHFETERIIQNVNHAIVAATFAKERFRDCAYSCSKLSSTRSLYYNEGTTTCYCNNQWDENAVVSSADGNIMYAYITQTSESVTISQQETFNTVKSGDWTVFQRRFDGSVNFYRNWTEYVNGFGSLSGEFWLGLEIIHQLTSVSSCELKIYLEAESTHPVQTSGYARYSSFWVDSAETNFTIHVSGFNNATVGDSFSVHNNAMFSTYDVDNDKAAPDCAKVFKGGWWYQNCHFSNLNGPYLAGEHTTFADGMNWANPWGFFYSLLKTEMMYKCM